MAGIGEVQMSRKTSISVTGGEKHVKRSHFSRDETKGSESFSGFRGD